MEDKNQNAGSPKLLIFHSMEELTDYLRHNDPGGIIEIRVEKEEKAHGRERPADSGDE